MYILDTAFGSGESVWDIYLEGIHGGGIGTEGTTAHSFRVMI
jgi:hypothetical protein